MVSHMIIEALWVSQQGTRTSDNRDHAGIGIRQGEFLGVVVDGSTHGAANGEYARSIVQMLVDWFVETGDVITDDLMVQVLRELHENLRKRYPRGSASLLLIYAAESDSISVIHSGDCVLGELDRHDGVNWRTSPHTLTNALVEMPLKDIAQSATRHLLTRSFRARGFELPDIVKLPEFSGSLVLATDGFWAELSEKDQARFLAGHQASTATDRDDRSVLLLRISLSNHLAFVMYDKSSKNLYRRTTDGDWHR
jgi:serine/threonine protein phosphatase PrpC